MNDRKQIQKYVNNFRRQIAPYLRPDVGIKVCVHPVRQKGGVVEIQFGHLEENDDSYTAPASTINDVLKRVPQHAFGGNLDGFRFEGTNIVMEPRRVILIKGGDKRSDWDEKAAARDISRIFHHAAPARP